MIALISLFIILILSITVVRIGATALELTGISPEVASFQAQSAFSGAGFTTTESESIVNHPVRRRIIRIMILLGSVGITSVIATVILTFTGSQDNMMGRSGLLLAGLICIYLLARSKWIAALTKKVIVKALSMNRTLQLHDYYEILGIAKGYSVSRIKMKKDNWATDKTLKELHLNKEGTLVLSIHRTEDGQEKFIVPNGETVIRSGDEITVYGRKDGSACLSNRPQGKDGDYAHAKQCAEAKKMEEMQELEQT